jgi:hypothetical protein
MVYAAAVVSWRMVERRAVRMAVVALRPAVVSWYRWVPVIL